MELRFELFCVFVMWQNRSLEVCLVKVCRFPETKHPDCSQVSRTWLTLLLPVSGHGGVQRPAAPEAAQTVPAPAPPSESCEQGGWRYKSVTVEHMKTKQLPRVWVYLSAVSLSGSYEPPLTNVFTMQWFLTMFATCLPAPTVLKIWDSVFFEGSEVLFRVALAIWERLGEYVFDFQLVATFSLPKHLYN